MVIGEITVEGPLEMALVEGNDMIQAFPTEATDNALGIRVLPRALRCDGAFFHSQMVNPFSKVISVDGIAITQQILRWWLPWKSLNKLLSRPFSRRMLRHIEVDYSAAIVSQDYKHEQDTKSYRGNGEEVDRHGISHMLL